MTRLVMVSNRVADPGKDSQSGGLAVALGDALREYGGIWFGWDGRIDDTPAHQRVALNDDAGYCTATLSLTQQEYDGYYNGMGNNVLWPILHYRLDLAKPEKAYTDAYMQVNRRFADTLRALVQSNDLVWIHDYHLFPLGAELRARGCGNPLGFFLHIPFPPPDILRAMPDCEAIIRALFSYDVVGMQTAGDIANFKRYITDQADGTIDDAAGTATAFGRTITVKAYPIGIDVDTFRAMARTDEAEGVIDRLQRRTSETIQIIGVDRLDYSKGLPERFTAFQYMLERYTGHQKGVTLMQIAPPTRENVDAYSDIREELERRSGAINGQFADFDWTPIRYIHRPIARRTLAALFRGSRIGLVTPLRDGMNLVAKEYVAAQNDDDPGVLILSKFAGAAEDLQDALLVNPYDTSEVGEKIAEAISMPLGQRRERHEALLARVRANDVNRWRSSFISDLSRAGEA
ncbi:MAG: trehalose-6-phosphate synthase [Pseudomonadota bacterium]